MKKKIEKRMKLIDWKTNTEWWAKIRTKIQNENNENSYPESKQNVSDQKYSPVCR